MITAALSALSSRAGLVAIALVIGYLYGFGVAREGAASGALKAENAALRDDLKLSHEAAERAASEAEDLRRLQFTLQEKLDAYAKNLAERVEERGACRLDEHDVGRLRDLR